MAAAAKRAVHLEVKVMVAALRKFGGFAAALCFAKSLMKLVDSRLQRPPISSPRTTRRERPCPNSSGYVRSVAWRARRRAAPWHWPWCRRGWPVEASGDTRVVSTASWEPFQRGRPFAITSIRRSSWRVAPVFKSRTKTLVLTRAPASLQIRAAARSEASDPQCSGSGASSPVFA